MLWMGIIEPLGCSWTSGIVLGPNTNGNWRFCNDFCGLNKVSASDFHLLHGSYDLINQLHLHLKKRNDIGRSLLQRSQKKDNLLSWGHWHNMVHHSVLYRAPMTFQQLIDIVLRHHQHYAADYLNDIYFKSWLDHLVHLGKVVWALKEAGTQ